MMSWLVSSRWWWQSFRSLDKTSIGCLALLVFAVVAQPLVAGPLAEAVDRARAAAGVEQPAAAIAKQPSGKPDATDAFEPAANLTVAPAVVSLAVPLPLSGNRDTKLRAAILRQLDQLTSQPDQRGLLVLQFNAANPETAGESDFARSLALARFLTDPQMAGVKTVAFLPSGASGHAVLVALACEEIVMAPDAVLGPANWSEPRIDEAMRVAYREIAARRRTVPPPLAVALLDPASEIAWVATEAGDQIISSTQLPALRQRVQVLNVDELGPAPLEITGRRGRQLGVVRLLASTPLELAAALDLDPAVLRVDPSLERGWQAAVVNLTGPITATTVARVQSRLDEALASGANFLCLEIDSPGGTPEQSLVLARWLADQDAGKVRTVAYIPRQARGDAALIALACDELVMEDEAVLGGEGAAAISTRQAEALAVAWREVAAGRSARSWSLPLALVLPDYIVSRMVQRTSGRTEYFSETERQAREDRDAWQVEAPLPAGPLAVDAAEAEAYGLAESPVKSFSELASRYGLGDDIDLIEPGWANRLLEALASPGLAWLLLLIGGAGLYIELQTPGLGFGGFISMVAFIVYFWSQYLNGTSGWLEVMLFLAGLVCLAAEIFVVPGMGVLGLGGGLLLISSLVLASQSFFLPANAYQVRQLQLSLMGILGAGLGVAVFGVLVRRWLPSTPVLRHVLLVPPEDKELVESLDNLIGAGGVTTTRLAPAGQAEVAGQLRDVWSEGMLIEPGTAIRVSAVQAGRVLVLPLDAEEAL